MPDRGRAHQSALQIPEPDAETRCLQSAVEPLGAEWSDSSGRGDPPRRCGDAGMKEAEIKADRLWSRQLEADRMGAAPAGGGRHVALAAEGGESGGLSA